MTRTARRRRDEVTEMHASIGIANPILEDSAFDDAWRRAWLELPGLPRLQVLLPIAGRTDCEPPTGLEGSASFKFSLRDRRQWE